MSQAFSFYKLIIFSEEVKNFPRENVHDALRSLFKGSDHCASDMIGQYFEEVSLEQIVIDYEQAIEINPEISKKLKYIFKLESSSLFLIDEKNWTTIQQIIEKNILHIFDQKDKISMQERLSRHAMIGVEYKLLKELFEKHLLLAEVS
ncbi:MAG: hypothetical protein KME12_04935 [Trichocoleus desertorum ATA4-8-CV12]|jgi:hypothetical protein|nr:hypothetical protein [Trichocoleus desertorum ATA4-8-CV12]